MQVSVETLSGLERKVTISLPSERIEEEVQARLKNIARKAKIDGFRPGKAPLNVVKNKYSGSVREEVTRDIARSSLHEALQEKALTPAGYPSLHPEVMEPGKDFSFSAVFEVFPEVTVNELNQAEVEVIRAEVKDSDVDQMIDKLREQNKTWNSVTRAVKDGDKIVMNFEGFVDGKAFEGGKAEAFELVIGSKSMIPGFEDALIGKNMDKEFDIQITFPADYGHEPLAGKDATFTISITDIMEGQLPELDDAFCALFNVAEGIEALRKDIKQNMERELERRLSNLNRDAVFEKLSQLNPFDVPNALVEREIENLMHEMYHRIFGPEHSENEKIPNFPREMFVEQAKKRVHMGLLFSEYVKKHEIASDATRVNAMLEKIASAYESPDELRSWYKTSKERMAELEALVLEEMVCEKILSDAKTIDKLMDYNEVVNPSKDNKGE